MARAQNDVSRRPPSGPHEVMRELYHSLIAEQRRAVCFDWDYCVDIQSACKPLYFADPNGTMAQTHENPLARLHALWTLEGLNALDEALRCGTPTPRCASEPSAP